MGEGHPVENFQSLRLLARERMIQSVGAPVVTGERIPSVVWTKWRR